MNKLIYGIKDKPKFPQLIVFALQQMLAIMAATLVVPILVNSYGAVNLEMDIAAALLGAGAGTAVYIAAHSHRCICKHGRTIRFGKRYSIGISMFFGLDFRNLIIHRLLENR